MQASQSVHVRPSPSFTLESDLVAWLFGLYLVLCTVLRTALRISGIGLFIVEWANKFLLSLPFVTWWLLLSLERWLLARPLIKAHFSEIAAKAQIAVACNAIVAAS
jgi:hypothetical protein